ENLLQKEGVASGKNLLEGDETTRPEAAGVGVENEANDEAATGSNEGNREAIPAGQPEREEADVGRVLSHDWVQSLLCALGIAASGATIGCVGGFGVGGGGAATKEANQTEDLRSGSATSFGADMGVA